MGYVFDLIEPLWKVATNIEKANKEREKRNKIEILKLKLDILKLSDFIDKKEVDLIVEELNQLNKKG